MTKTADLYLFKNGSACRVVGLALFVADAERMAKTLNAKLTEEQKKEGYEYVVMERE